MTDLTLERICAKNRKIPDDEVIYAAVKAGLDHREIAARHGCDAGLIRMHIRRKGWDKGEPLLINNRAWPSDERFMAWIDEGLTYFEMAGRTGFHADTIRQRIKLRGLFRRYSDVQARAKAGKATALANALRERAAEGPKPDARRVVLDSITLRDGKRIPGPLSLPRVSMIAGWKGRPAKAGGEDGV